MEIAEQLAQRVIAALVAQGDTLATAESLTGGLIGATLTSVPGASAAYLGGAISYATELKRTMLHVDAQILDSAGAVSRPAVEAMAAGAQTLTGAAWAVAVSGVAGPDPQEGKAPGTVWIALVDPDCVVRSECLSLSGDRSQIRASTVISALRWVESAVRERSGLK